MTPRDLRPEMWRIIRRVGAQGRPFDVLQVRGQLRGAIRRERVRDYLKALEAGGYLVPCTLDDGAPGWQLLRDPGNEAPRVRADGTREYMSLFHAFYVVSYTATTIGFGEIPNAFSDAQRESFVHVHGDILTPEFWRGVQDKVRAGEMMEVLPYHPHRVRVASSL